MPGYLARLRHGTPGGPHARLRAGHPAGTASPFRGEAGLCGRQVRRRTRWPVNGGRLASGDAGRESEDDGHEAGDINRKARDIGREARDVGREAMDAGREARDAIRNAQAPDLRLRSA
jgi:hypothetical protein